MSIFYPDIILNNIFDIDILKLKKNNIKAIIFDIDNTLGYNHEMKPSLKVQEFLKKLLESGFKVIISSNNKKERVDSYCENLGVLYVYKAAKPLVKKTFDLLDKIKIEPKNCCIVGDQIFTDVLCGKFGRMKTIMVKPFDYNENKFIKFKRIIEKIILKNYYKKKGLNIEN